MRAQLALAIVLAGIAWASALDYGPQLQMPGLDSRDPDLMNRIDKLEKLLEREKREYDALPKVDPRSLPKGKVISGMLEARQLKISYLGIRDVKSLLLFFFFEDRPLMSLLLFGMALTASAFVVTILRLFVRMRRVRPLEDDLKDEELRFARSALLAEKAEMGRRLAKGKEEEKKLDAEIDKQSDLAEKSADKIDALRASIDAVPKALTWTVAAAVFAACALVAAAVRLAFGVALRVRTEAAEAVYLDYLARCEKKNPFAVDPDWLVSLWSPSQHGSFGGPSTRDAGCERLEAALAATNPGNIWPDFIAALAPAQLLAAGREALGTARTDAAVAIAAGATLAVLLATSLVSPLLRKAGAAPAAAAAGSTQPSPPPPEDAHAHRGCCG